MPVKGFLKDRLGEVSFNKKGECKMNYTLLHLHTELSSCTTNIDSVTNYKDYIKKAKELGMKAIAFTEHGNLFEWYKKKQCCEEHGLKYIHGIEAYITETLDKKIKDNYHCCLYALNYEGFLELNSLVSDSFNRKGNNYYYTPRIAIDDLFNTSDNIAITSACLGGFFGKGSDSIKNRVIEFMIKNKERCFLEIQPHLVDKQIELNKYLYDISLKTGLRLIVGTDTHALDNMHLRGRTILQKAKDVKFGEEEGWDLTFKSYQDLLSIFKKHNYLPNEVYIDAINNTNILADKVEEFKIDTSYKYPKIYRDSLKTIKKKINNGIVFRGVNKLKDYKEVYVPRIYYELDTYIHNNAIDFLLLDEDVKTEMRGQGRYCGYSRGSCSGSLIAYLIGMTDIDPIRHKLNFERFMNKERVSLADVDTDWEPADRDIVKEYLYNKKGLYCADIVTFNTVALKGAIRDVCRAVYKAEPPRELLEKSKREYEAYGYYTDWTSKELDKYYKKYLEIANYICSNVEDNEDKMRKEYPDVFEYVDIINGTIVSMGTHPCGVVVSPFPLEDKMGLCSLSTCINPVTMISMKSIDSQNYVKLDILGLDNIQLINETCKLANIERLIPENTPEDDVKVWKSIRDDSLLIFQWESDSASRFLKTLLSDKTIAKIKEKNPNFRYMDLLSMGNGAIRPAGASYRQALSEGVFRDNGHFALNELLAPTMGYLVYQEQILEFLHKFCGYTMGEADIVRRGFAKKTGTDQFIPKIQSGFIKTMKDKYKVSEEESKELIVNFIKVIEDASSYLFSLNHSEPYSYIGYICGYLRYYYPLEFITVALNINKDNLEKTSKIINYANRRGVKIESPKFGYSKGEYFFNSETRTIYKGIGCIKNLNSTVGEELYNLSKERKHNDFSELLIDLNAKTSINSRQLDILIKLQFFSEFGKTQKLLKIVEIYNAIYTKKQFSKSKLPFGLSEDVFRKYTSVETKAVFKEVDKEGLIKELIDKIPNKDIPLQTLLESEINNIGYVQYKNTDLDKRYVLITSLNTKYTPRVSTYSLGSGVSVECKIPKKLWRNLDVGNIIYINSMERRQKSRKVGEDEKGKPIFEKIDEYEWFITNYSIVNGLIDRVLEELDEEIN